MILLTGATGNIGSELVAQLSGRGLPLRVVTRDEAKVARLDSSIERVIGDLHDRETIQRAVAGVERLFMISLIFDESHKADALLVEEAKRAGVRHVVKISSLGVRTNQAVGIGALHRAKELAVEESGMAWTFLRPGAFMSNALQWVGSIKSRGRVFNPNADGKLAPISPHDIAAVAAVALTSAGHEGQAYDLTGSELLSAHDQVRILSQVLGKPIECEDISIDAGLEQLRSFGAPAFLAESLAQLWTMVRSGKAAIKTGEVERLTGRPAQTFETWCQEHKNAFL